MVINDVIFGLRLEVSDPIEYGRNFVGIRKRYIEYKHKTGISLRAGDFFDIISRGLSMNVFEDRGLAYDTGIDGIRIIYKKIGHIINSQYSIENRQSICVPQSSNAPRG